MTVGKLKTVDELNKAYDAVKNRKTTVQEGDMYVITYTRIITDIPGFREVFEGHYEIIERKLEESKADK